MGATSSVRGGSTLYGATQRPERLRPFLGTGRFQTGWRAKSAVISRYLRLVAEGALSNSATAPDRHPLADLHEPNGCGWAAAGDRQAFGVVSLHCPSQLRAADKATLKRLTWRDRLMATLPE